MNKIKTKRLLCTSLSIMILGTTVFVGGIPRVDAYAADDTNAAISTATPILVGAGKTVGVLRSVEYVNDSNYYGDVVVATINNGDEDYSYFAEVGTQSAEDLKNIAIGQNITINYVTGTPVQCDSKCAFPITSISTTTINQTTYTDSQGVIYQLNENDKTAIISSKTAISGDIVIPQQITANGEQYTVTVIGENAFGKCSNLKSIVIPDSVTRIGQYAFYGCINLENVTLPNNLTAIEERTFSGCSSLKSIILPQSIKDIGYNAFYGCDSLLSLTIPSSLTFIGNNTADRLSYVNTFIMKQNNNNFTTEDGVVFSRENPAATATPLEPDYREICGIGNCSGTIKSKKYIQYDYLHDGTSQEYLILTITDYKGNDSSFFIEKNSNECNEIEKANIGQHIELVCTTGTPIFNIDSNGNCAAPLSSLIVATSTETPATSTVVEAGTETVATSTATSGEICGVGKFSGTIKAKNYIKYDYSHDGSSQDYLILTVTDCKGNDFSVFTEKNSEESNKIEGASIGQHIDLVYTTGTPIFDSSIKYAAPLSSFVLATSTETPATSTTVATGTEVAGTSTVATSTTVEAGTETVTSTETAATSEAAEAGTETSATSTIAISTATTTGGNAKTGDTASLMTVAMFMAGSAGIMLKKGKK